MSRRRFLRIAAFGTASAAVLGPRSILSANGLSGEATIWSGIALGAEAAIQIHGLAPARAEELLTRCRAELVRLETIFSLYDERSALARLNRNGELRAAPAELVEVLRHGLTLSEVTGGAFDVSVQPLCALYAAVAEALPEPSALRAAQQLVDHRQIAVHGDRIILAKQGMQLTLNGLAQGYITDRIADLLRENGCRHTLVDLGEKRALGPHGSGRPWRLGVESPMRRGVVVDLLELSEGALATSGGYGTRYGGGRHHLLDARFGKNPADGFLSVSVLAPTALQADGLSTAIAVMRPDEAWNLLDRFPRCTAHVVRSTDSHRLKPLV